MVAAAPTVAYLTLRFTLMPLANHFEREYPHDGQNSLGAFAGVLGLGITAGALALVGLFIWTLVRTDRIEREEKANTEVEN